MPQSKKRTRPAAAPLRAQRPVTPTTPEKALTVASLALTQAALQIVQEAELHIARAARTGEGVEDALEVHHYLRTAALGMLCAYSKLEGLPDPRDQVPTP